ncbi:MAG: ABC transporter ATP-binding protein/permease [Oscillospiraceae bacterium]|nr:ABC transporter ATP-binding protein/permease [Oscillospiraceae bacterium]
MKRIFTFCKPYLQIHKWTLILYITLSVVMSTSTLISPYIVGDFMDYLLIAENMSFAVSYFLLFVGINVASIVIGYIAGRTYVHLQNRLGYALNCVFIEKMQHSALGFIDNQDTAYLNQRINNDSNALIIFCINVIQSIIVNVVIILATLILLFSFHTTLAGILLGVASVYFLIYTLYKKTLYKANLIYQEAQSVFFGKLHEQLAYVRFIKVQSLYSMFIERLNHSFFPLLKSAFKRQRASYVFGSFDQLVLIVVQVILLLFGGAEIIAGRLSIGRFVIMSSYFNMMLGALRYFFGMGETIQSNLVSFNRLKSLAEIKREENGNQCIGRIDSIELKNLSFFYGDLCVINNMSRVFKKGTLYTVRGGNGSGKSTLLNIMLGLHTGEFTGQVMLNGIPIESVDMCALRSRLIGVAEQEPTLLADSVMSNIQLHSRDTSKEKLELLNKLSKILDLDEFIQSLPDKFETVINEHSNNLSGGEKQKIAILRTLLKDPEVIILDEPTSALDEYSRKSLGNYLNDIKANKIIIIVTHDKECEFIDNENIVYL